MSDDTLGLFDDEPEAAPAPAPKAAPEAEPPQIEAAAPAPLLEAAPEPDLLEAALEPALLEAGDDVPLLEAGDDVPLLETDAPPPLLDADAPPALLEAGDPEPPLLDAGEPEPPLLEAATAEAPAKRRGRPRKHPLPESDTPAAATPAPEPDAAPATERKVALVTGASRGIGRGIALALAREGWFVVVNYAGNAAAADECLASVRAAGGDGVTVQADVARAMDRDRLVAAALEPTGRIDLLVNNAGIAPEVRGDLLDVSEESFDRLMAVNLRGVFFLTQRVAREMIARKHPDERPAIVTISSISAVAASVNRGEYSLSKSALPMLTALFAARLAPHGVGVYEVRPGVIATDMTAGVRDKYDRMIAEGGWPIARWGTPEDVGKAVAVIARGEYPFSTGDTFHVDGGFHLRTL